MGKYLTVEERLRVLELKKEGMQQKNIAKAIGRSPSAVSYLINKGEHSVLRMKVDADVPKKTLDVERPTEEDLSKFPDNIFFKQIDWAIPVLLIIFFSSCYPARDATTGNFWTHEHILKRMTTKDFNHCKIYYDLNNNPIPYK